MRLNPGAQQFLRFAAVGVAGLVVDLLVLYGLMPVWGWYGARIASFWAAASATWWLNRRFTFNAKSSEVSIGSQYSQYLVAMLLGGAVNYATYAAVLRWSPIDNAAFSALFGVGLGSVAGMFFNFASARYWIFKKNG